MLFGATTTAPAPSPAFASMFHRLKAATDPATTSIRAQLEAFFQRYPQKDSADLAGRFRTEENHHAAFFELALHEMLTRLGCTVDVEPRVPRTAKNPDFLATLPRGEQFYLEAYYPRDPEYEGSLARLRDYLGNLTRHLARRRVSGYWIGYASPTWASRLPSVKPLITPITSWLTGLDRPWLRKIYDSPGRYEMLIDDVVSLDGGDYPASHIPVWPLRSSCGGAHPPFQFVAYPTVAGPAQAFPYNVHILPSPKRLDDAIAEKADEYKLESTYIVALGFHEHGPDQHRATLEIAGTYTATAWPEQFRRVSGIVLVDHVCPLTMNHMTPRLLENPSAARGITADVKKAWTTLATLL